MNISSILGYKPSYEIIGDIAIIYQQNKQIYNSINNIHLLGKTIFEYHKKNIRTVLYSLSSIDGEFRTRKFEYIYGLNKKNTCYKENGCSFYINLEKVYFTQHLATERKRILDSIKDGDIIIDMFAGVGPFSILIAKKKKNTKVIAIDKNPDAIQLLK